MLKGFSKGGIHAPEYKISEKAAIEPMPLPEIAVVPLCQHIGAPAVAVVKKGDTVQVGQVIATAGGFVSAPVHAPVSGTVTAVDALPDNGGVRRPTITIRVEGDQWLESIDRSETLISTCDLSPKEILEKITAAGLVGMGGATFPTHVKLAVPPGKHAEMLIINGVECEPFLTADHRLMLERGEEVLIGVRLLARVLGVSKVYIGIENNKPDAIEHLSRLSAQDPQITVVPLRVRYPQGGEKQLIEAVSGRQVPSGGLPIDVGAVVQNVGTAFAVYEAVQKNKPLIERIVTVTGRCVEHPSNLRVRIGTPLSALIERCGGMPADAGKVISGGPMMGRAVSNLEAPVTKGTSGILLIRERGAVRKEAGSCIKCAKCVTVCPMGLEPYRLSTLSKLGRFEDAEAGYITDCIECGSCAYTCPAMLPLLDYIRLGKAEVMRRVRARKSAPKA
ncbi:MAG: electron transport complex subunit RsxC [Alistipes sp.]|nr:electron transport complex subunit RsxC [Alistipes sp.]